MSLVAGRSPPTSQEADDTLAFRAAHNPEAELSRTQATPAGAFRAAREMFVRGQRLDMRSLAAELDISRATLYRWCGDREQLLSDVLWSLSHQIFQRAKAEHPRHTGAKRVLAIFRQHTSEIVRADPLRVFLQQETHAALRLLTSESGGVQRRTVADLADLLREEQVTGPLRLRADEDSLAYAIVKITEGFIYHDTVVGAEPDVERAASIVALLLG
jgi:AcrR family transcriptional regulator